MISYINTWCTGVGERERDFTSLLMLFPPVTGHIGLLDFIQVLLLFCRQERLRGSLIYFKIEIVCTFYWTQESNDYFKNVHFSAENFCAFNVKFLTRITSFFIEKTFYCILLCPKMWISHCLLRPGLSENFLFLLFRHFVLSGQYSAKPPVCCQSNYLI